MSDPMEVIYEKQDLETLNGYLEVLEKMFSIVDDIMDDGLKSISKKLRDGVADLINSINHPETCIGEALDHLVSAKESLGNEILVVKECIKDSNKLKSGKYILK
jgi:hypothetical protein